MDATIDALEAIHDYPVRALGDLIKKVEMIEEVDFADIEAGAILAHLRRIAET